MAEQLTKWSVTDGTVIRHMHYGLRVQILSGEIGVVDRVDIADGYLNPADWLAIGSVITVVGAGYAGSQLRLSTRPSHLDEASPDGERPRSNGPSRNRRLWTQPRGSLKLPQSPEIAMSSENRPFSVSVKLTNPSSAPRLQP
ncbi:hypothetical protein [Streptomyces sp. NBC_00316]|uniref:hypothetical protein n=1 Tax=Streptomyces sp. NBC_00316 TaxID=2975710 RepID=UPI002E290E6B|nr:hypothetical protein [Streptomyces sp. NBC_00316]